MFLTKKNFSKKIEEIITQMPDISYMEAIVVFCETNDIPIEDVKGLINKQIREKMKEEAVDLHLLKESSFRLSIL